MFRALCAHHQEAKTVLYSIWYRHTGRWASGAEVERGSAEVERGSAEVERGSPLPTSAPDGHLQRMTIPDAVYYNFYLMVMSTIVLETCRGIK